MHINHNLYHFFYSDHVQWGMKYSGYVILGLFTTFTHMENYGTAKKLNSHCICLYVYSCTVPDYRMELMVWRQASAGLFTSIPIV